MKAVVLATVCVGAVASSASAVDLRIKSQLGQTFEINDNRDLRVNPLGVTYAPVSTLLFDVLARTPTTQFVATSNFAYRTYFGEGAVNTMDGLDKDANARFTKTTKLTTYDIGASWSQRDAGTVQLEDIGIRTVRGDVTTYALNGGIKHRFSSRDTFSFVARSSSVSFTSPTQNPYNDISTVATWTHRATRTLDLIGLIDYYFKDAATNEVTIWKAIGGVDARISRRLTFKGSAGAVFVSGSGTFPSLSSAPTSGSAVGWIADALMSYRLRQTTRISISASRSVSPDALGDIQARESISASLTEEINRRSSLSFASGYSRFGATTPGGASDSFNASASYAYRLTPELRTNIAYRYAQRMNGNGGTGSGTARSNSVVFSINRDVTILP